MNRRERRGAWFLAMLSLLTALIPRCLPEPVDTPQVLPSRYASLPEGDEAEPRPATPRGPVRSGGQARDDRPGLQASQGSSAADGPTLFPFDPNTADSLDLIRLGLGPRATRNLLKYRRAGGRFRRPEELGKVYGLAPERLEALKPYVRVPPAPDRRAPPAAGPSPDAPAAPRTALDVNRATPAALRAALDVNRATPAAPRAALDVNRATPDDWEALYGIGPVLAARIVKFRTALGGFHTVEQVAETYGLPDSTFRGIRSRLVLESPWRRWPVNHLGADSLARHPYLRFRQARALVAYRDQHGPYRQADDLRRLHLLPDSVITRLEPYLRFE